jgi:RHS repeat-associated protein
LNVSWFQNLFDAKRKIAAWKTEYNEERPPKPGSDTHTKRKQLEFDGLGRLSSVCEITAGANSGSCGQDTAQTGYRTAYAYDTAPNVNSLTVTQNGQPSGGTLQTRTYIYDMLGRLTQETNPETGTTSYVYDTDTTCSGGYPTGNLVKLTDAVGNVTCYAYDQLHRLTSITYPSGSYSASTDKKYFVYDSANVGGAAMQNAKGRLAEAYTCPATGACTSKKTDLGFSYSARGETASVYQKTPNSGSTYYQVSASYWAHGGINALSSNLTGLPTITYGATDGSGLDGEGRVTKVTASSGQSPLVSSVTYTASGTTQPIGSLTQVTFGSSDYDTFSYDPNTGRLNQYKFNVGTTPTTATSNLTWNANGSLGGLAVTDQLNSANTQTCNYSYDDLGRVASANCGTPWNQTFSFDPFGNINKTATAGITFQPTYSPSTNRYSSVPGCTPSYDAAGFALNDCAHTYSWDSAGNPLTIDGVNLIYDALGRMVEQAAGSTYTQIVYGPGGGKLASMNGQTLKKAFVPLPGGGAAAYTSAGLLYYRHSDWLGSGRLATTPNRTLYFDVAYGPYGENYASSGTPDLDFTGQNQDTVSGLYDFMFREYNTNQGRWPSPDPAGMRAVSMGNPQTWNRYAYLGNAPLNSVDSSGLMSDAVSYLRAMARTAAFFSSYEFFTFSELEKSWTAPEVTTSSVSSGMEGDPLSMSPGSISLGLQGGGWSFQINTTMVGYSFFTFSLGANDFKPWEMRSSVVALLRAKNDCSDWFNKGQGSAADLMSHVPIWVGKPNPGPRAGADADTAPDPNSPITVYPDGRFYPDSKSGIPIGGVFPPGSHGARMIILLHELAHKVFPDFPDDSLSSADSDKNTKTVMDHCGKAVQ